MSELPNGWALAALSELCKQPDQRSPHADETFTYIDIASVDRDLKIVSEPQRLIGANASSRARKLVECGDVIISMTRPNLNAVALIGEQYDGCIASTGFDVLRPIEVEPRWIFSAVRSAHFVDAMCKKVQGALYPAVKSADIRDYQIPLPPLAEQARIAAKLDELLAQVDTLKARIDGIPTLLKRFRQSVLTAAISGRLTENYREQAKDTQVTLPQHPPTSHHQIYSEDSFTPPSNWLITALGNLASFQQGLQIAKSERRNSPSEDSMPILRTVNYENEFKDDVHYAIVTEKSIIAEPQDIILSRTGTVGRVLTGHKGIMHNNSFRINYESQLLRRDYLIYFLESPICQLYIKKKSGKSSQPDLTHKEFSKCPALVPPICEQKEIVRCVKQLFSLADQLESRVKEAQARIDRLTQSILTKAFCGELIPQDPNDEPASVLLERIKAQRTNAPKVRRNRQAAKLNFHQE